MADISASLRAKVLRSRCISTLPELARDALSAGGDCVVSDVGSTKRMVLDRLASSGLPEDDLARFVGAKIDDVRNIDIIGADRQGCEATHKAVRHLQKHPFR